MNPSTLAVEDKGLVGIVEVLGALMVTEQDLICQAGDCFGEHAPCWGIWGSAKS
jgi:hypothetical protein